MTEKGGIILKINVSACISSITFTKVILLDLKKFKMNPYKNNATLCFIQMYNFSISSGKI